MLIPSSCFIPSPPFPFGNKGAPVLPAPVLLFPRARLCVPCLPSLYGCLSPHLQTCIKLQKQEKYLTLILPLSVSEALSLYGIQFS